MEEALAETRRVERDVTVKKKKVWAMQHFAPIIFCIHTRVQKCFLAMVSWPLCMCLCMDNEETPTLVVAV